MLLLLFIFIIHIKCTAGHRPLSRTAAFLDIGLDTQTMLGVYFPFARKLDFILLFIE